MHLSTFYRLNPASFSLAFLAIILSSCAFNFERSTGNLNRLVNETQLANLVIIDVDIDNRHVIKNAQLSGSITLSNETGKLVNAAEIQFEISSLGELSSVWAATLDTPDILPNQTQQIAFIFYHEDIVATLDTAEIDVLLDDNFFSRRKPGSKRTSYELELVVRSRNNEFRTPFVIYNINE